MRATIARMLNHAGSHYIPPQAWPVESDVEVLGLRMVDDDGAGGLFGIDLPVFSERAADAGGVQEGEEFFLVAHVRARGIAEAVARAAVMLREQVANLG